MSFIDLLFSALRALRTNLGRSFLTIIGIVIGVAAIALVMSLGAGASNLILNQIQSVGGDTIVIRPGRQPQGPNDFAEAILSDSLKKSDVEALRRAAPALDIASVEPILLVPGTVASRDDIYKASVIGWNSEAVANIFQLSPSEGVLFGEEDIKSYSKVAVIGYRVNDELFNGQSGLGQNIKIKNTAFRVVGILPKRGQIGFFNFDEVVIVPPTTAQRDLLAIDHFHEIMVKAQNTEAVNTVVEDLKILLRERHRITDPAKDDFFIETQQNLLEQISTITQVLTIFLAAIATISLVVGGVGIMNIMLVSVTERTREIGLRKALGARSRDILWQFLIEALILTLSGGLLGTLIAVSLSALIAFVLQRYFSLDWKFQLPFTALALGLGMAGLVGLTFGIYPARRASKLSPIEALRYE